MVTNADPSTILLHATEDANRRSDGQANGTITPGHLVERDSVNTSRAKDVYEMTVQSTEDERTAPLVALEYEKTGRGIDDDYSDGDSLEYYVAQPGDRLYMWVASGTDTAATADANISVGDKLVPFSDGSLEAVSGGSAGNEMFEALEAVDNSGASAGDQARIRVEAI